MVIMGTLALGFLYFPSLLLLTLNIICCGLDLVESKLAFFFFNFFDFSYK